MLLFLIGGYNLSFSSRVKLEIEEKMLNNFSNEVDDDIKRHIANSFLERGYIANPDKEYHLEFVFKNLNYAENLLSNLNYFNLGAKIIQRKNNSVVYIKDSESIADFLNIIFAHDSLMDFYNIKILKDISGNINRKVNLEAANINKIIEAAVSQKEDIKYILEKSPKSLSKELFKIANTRIENMDASLKEIGEKFNPPLSKSCVNHRFRKIKKIADKLRDNEKSI
ncbi:MAG: DNA-binding protein WhiA [Defluviitaleaceae bacterium]|nr:DNA-binding protein WhiA [Defluviitaleaceae bacterium]